MLDIAVYQRPHALTVCRIAGDLVGGDASLVRRARHTLTTSDHITIDLGGVTGVDPPGLAALAGLLRRAMAMARHVDLRDVPPAMLARLRAAGFDRLVPIVALDQPASPRSTVRTAGETAPSARGTAAPA